MLIQIANLVFLLSWGMIAYTYVLFPVLLALSARMWGRKPVVESQAHAELPRVAMVVAAYNEVAVIREKLRNTFALDYPADRFKLYVGSDGSDDGTVEVLKGCNDLRVVTLDFKERRGKISVLNEVMAAVDADVVIMSDANTMFEPEAVRSLVRHFSDPLVGCVSGELHLERDGGVSGEGIYWKYEGWIKRSESRLGFLIGCNGGIFAIRRSLYEALPPSTLVEDFVLTMRVLERGHQVVFEPEARATEPACISAKAEMVRKVRIGAGGFQALGLTAPLLHPRFGFCAFAYWGHKVLRWLVPVFLIQALLCNLLLLEMPMFQAALLVQLAGGLVAGWAYRSTSEQAVPRWVRPISYFYLMNFALLCGLLRFLFGTQRVTWERGAR